MEKYTDKQVFHENLSVEELEAALEELMQNHFRQLNGFDTEAEHILLVSKKGVPSYKKKKLQNAVNETATHNRKKNYLLEEGKVKGHSAVGGYGNFYCRGQNRPHHV